MAGAGVPPLRPRVEIPVCDPAPDMQARQKHFTRGQFLARQDAWEDLAEEIARAEADGLLTPGLTPVAMLLAEGARADVVEAACATVARGEPRSVRVILSAFQANLDDEPDVPELGYIAAMTQLEVALAWRGASTPSQLSQQRRAAYVDHMSAAVARADRFDPFEQQSVLWGALRCAVLEGDATPAARVADDYEDLIELDPRVPLHMRLLGRDCRPKRFGTWEVLDRQARRVAQQTQDVWGTAGYAWVYMGALEADAGAFRRIDEELFTGGLHDILERFPSQDMANRLAAFTGLTMGGPAEVGSPRRRIADAFGWITQDHLRELHPEVWADAPTLGRPLPARDNEDNLSKRGRIRALSSIGEYYAPALDAGRRLVFTQDSVRMLKGD